MIYRTWQSWNSQARG